MSYEQFVYWLRGYLVNFSGYIVTPGQFREIAEKLKEVKDPVEQKLPVTWSINSDNVKYNVDGFSSLNLEDADLVK